MEPSATPPAEPSADGEPQPLSQVPTVDVRPVVEAIPLPPLDPPVVAATPSAPTDPLIGKVLGGSYTVRMLLGQGGMGRVYAAQHNRLPRRAAVKVLKTDLVNSPEALERFRREAEVTSSLGSRHIVTVFDLGTLDDGSPFLLMEFLEGGDLADEIHAQRRLTPARVLTLMEQLVAGLAAAHDRQVIHRDIKPANLFLAREVDGGEVLKILDFGLSKMGGVSLSLTGQGFLGTPAYMSPEQLLETRQADHRTDIWAVGVTMFEMLTGEMPFEEGPFAALCMRIQTERPRYARAFAPYLTPEIDRVIARALEKKVEARYPTLRAFWEEARPALEGCIAALESNPDSQPVDSGPTRISHRPRPLPQDPALAGETTGLPFSPLVGPPAVAPAPVLNTDTLTDRPPRGAASLPSPEPAAASGGGPAVVSIEPPRMPQGINPVVARARSLPTGLSLPEQAQGQGAPAIRAGWAPVIAVALLALGLVGWALARRQAVEAQAQAAAKAAAAQQVVLEPVPTPHVELKVEPKPVEPPKPPEPKPVAPVEPVAVPTPVETAPVDVTPPPPEKGEKPDKGERTGKRRPGTKSEAPRPQLVDPESL